MEQLWGEAARLDGFSARFEDQQPSAFAALLDGWSLRKAWHSLTPKLASGRRLCFMTEYMCIRVQNICTRQKGYNHEMIGLTQRLRTGSMRSFTWQENTMPVSVYVQGTTCTGCCEDAEDSCFR